MPKPPASYEFGDRGAAWWKWAWKTPQAAGWSKGDLYLVARRAQLEDDVAALATISFDEPPVDDEELAAYLSRVKYVVQLLKTLAGNKLAVLREIREIDDRLGLTPKGLAALRWKIVDEEEGARAPVTPLRSVPPTPEQDPRRRLG